MLNTPPTIASRPIYGSVDASVSRFLSRLVDPADGVGSLRSVLLFAFVRGAAPLPFTLTWVDERAVLLDGLLGRVDLAETAFAADRFACDELGSLLLEPPFLLGLPFLLAPLALDLLLGEVPLDRGRRDALGELAEHLGACEHLRLV